MSKSFLIKDILSENSQSIISSNEIFLTKPIDLRYYFNHIKHSLYPTPLLLQKSIKDTEVKKSPLNALFEMTKKTFDKSDRSMDVSFKLTDELHKRKRRKNRTAFNAHQIYGLEKRFTHQKYLTPVDRDQIADELQLSAGQVITWFQNRRAKLKRDYEELKSDVNAASKFQVIRESVLGFT